MIVDLAGVFSDAVKTGLANYAAMDSLVLRHQNSVGAVAGELMDYFAASIYLRVFGEWENYLEQACLLSLAGRAPVSVSSAYVPISPASSLAEAREKVFGSQDYLLWHNPEKVIGRLQRHFSQSLLCERIKQHQDGLEWYATIRHAIAHRSEDAQTNFQRLARANLAQGFRAGPGRVLRSRTKSGEASWLLVITRELSALASSAWPQT